MGIDVGQHINFDFSRRRAGFNEQLAKRTKATIAAAHFQHFLIRQQQRTLIDGGALRAIEKLCGTEREGIAFPFHRGAGHEMRQHLQKDGWNAADITPVKRQPGFFQAGRGRNAIPKAQKMPPIFLRIRIGKGSDARSIHRLFRGRQKRGMQRYLRRAGFVGWHQFRPGEEGAPQIRRCAQPAMRRGLT